MIPIVLTTLGVAGLTLTTYWVFVGLLPRRAARREAARELVRRDPVDYTRAYFARVAPARLTLEQKVGDARAALEAAETKESRLRASFPGGVEPTHLKVVVTVAMCIVWFVAIAAAALIDLPIVVAVSGGNLAFGILGTVLILGVPVASSLALAELVRRRSGLGKMPFAAAVAGLLAAFVIVVALLTRLAPIRAEVEYADQIRTVKQQISQYGEDDDQNALRYANQHLEELQDQQVRSAQWNQVLVPIAAGLEFGAGFYAPGTVPVLMLLRARKDKDAAGTAVRKAQDKDAQRRTLQVQGLSRTFQWAGVSQADLQRAIITMAAENGAAPAQIEGPGQVEGPAQVDGPAQPAADAASEQRDPHTAPTAAHTAVRPAAPAPLGHAEPHEPTAPREPTAPSAPTPPAPQPALANAASAVATIHDTDTDDRFDVS